MRMHKVIILLMGLCQFAMGEQTNDSAKHIFVIVPSLSGDLHAASIWECQQVRSPYDGSGLSSMALDSAWNHFHDRGGVWLELVPELRDLKAAVNRVMNHTISAGDGGVPVGLRDDPSGLWRLHMDIARMPHDSSRDVWLLKRYLDRMGQLCGTNLCVDAAVPPRLFPGSVRLDHPCVLFVRPGRPTAITAAHDRYLNSFAQWSKSGVASTKGSTGTLEERWRSHVAFFNEIGVQFELLEVDVQRNLVILRGASDAAATYERLNHVL